MRKKSDVDMLIEQCIQDANCEYLEEGFMDNIKAGLNGAKEWVKADARNSFKLRNKNDVKNDRRWSQRKGKVSSYAKSIASTLEDFKKSGGTLGRGMKVDDVISRLNQVAQGKYPRGSVQTPNQNQQTPDAQQPQAQTKQSSNQQQTQPAQKTQQTPEEKTAQTSNTTVSNNTTTNNTVAQNKMLDSIGGNAPQKNTSNNKDNHSSQVNTETSSSSQASANANTQSQTPEVQNQQNTTPETKPKGDNFAKKAGKAIINGAKKMTDSVANGIKNFKDNAKARAAKKAKIKAEKKAAATKKSATPKPVDDKIVKEPKPAKTPAISAQPAPLEAIKKKLSPAEIARKAISRAQAATQMAKSNAPKLNIPGSDKPIKRKRIINAKEDKDISAARKEQEDFYKSLGELGAESEERVNESYYSSNTTSQLRMLNSIR